jgi:hypothetical protein
VGYIVILAFFNFSINNIIIMKKVLLSLIFIAFFSLITLAQEEADTVQGWSFSGFFQQNLNQVALSNWAAGGENSFSSSSKARFDANYLRESYLWENYVDLAYGFVKLEDNPLRKNADKIDLFSKLGKSITPRTSLSSIFNFVSQFGNGYQYPEEILISRFMAPGYLTIALGIDYKPWGFLSIFVSPATGKFTFVMDQDLANAGAFGVDPAEMDQQGDIIVEGQNIRSEFGALARLEFKNEVLTNVNVNSRITLFNNYSDSNVSNRKNIDIDWLTSITMPINRFISASIDFHLIYDDDIMILKYETIQGVLVQVGERPAVQLMQAFGLGLTYNF